MKKVILVGLVLLTGCCAFSHKDIKIKGDTVYASRSVYKNFDARDSDSANFLVAFNRK